VRSLSPLQIEMYERAAGGQVDEALSPASRRAHAGEP
jgi:hypothetical protein